MQFHPLEWTLMIYGVWWLIEAVILSWVHWSMFTEGDWPPCDEPPGVLLAVFRAITLPVTRALLCVSWNWIFSPEPRSD